MTNQSRREDDSYLRKVITALLITILVEGGSFIYYYGGLVERVDDIEKDIIALQSVDDAIINMDKTLYLLDNKVDYLTNRIDRNAKVLQHIKTEQDKRLGRENDRPN